MIDIFDKYVETIEKTDPIHCTGSVIRVRGMLLESRGPQSVIGEICYIHVPRNNMIIPAEVVGLNGTTVQLMAYSETQGVEIGCRVVASGELLSVPVSR